MYKLYCFILILYIFSDNNGANKWEANLLTLRTARVKAYAKYINLFQERMPDQWSFRTYMVYVYPVLDVSKYCRGFMNRVGYYYRMSSSYYYSYGDSNGVSIIEINEPPREFITIQKFDEIDVIENDDPQVARYSGELRAKPGCAKSAIVNYFMYHYALTL